MNTTDAPNVHYRLTVRLSSEHLAILKRVADERAQANPTLGSARGGARGKYLSSMVREAVIAHFGLPCADTKIDDRSEN